MGKGETDPASDSCNTTGDDGPGPTGESCDGVGNGLRVVLVGAVTGCVAAV